MFASFHLRHKSIFLWCYKKSGTPGHWCGSAVSQGGPVLPALPPAGPVFQSLPTSVQPECYEDPSAAAATKQGADIFLTMKMLFMASSMTRMTLGSLTSSRPMIASNAPHCTRVTTCSTVPPLVKLVTAHTASLWVLKSPWNIQGHVKIFRKVTRIPLNHYTEHFLCWTHIS